MRNNDIIGVYEKNFEPFIARNVNSKRVKLLAPDYNYLRFVFKHGQKWWLAPEFERREMSGEIISLITACVRLTRPLSIRKIGVINEKNELIMMREAKQDYDDDSLFIFSYSLAYPKDALPVLKYMLRFESPL